MKRPIIENFTTHLQTLNYSKGTIIQCQLSVKQYQEYLDKDQIKLKDTSTKTIAKYFKYLYHKPNEKRAGGLSSAYIKKHRQSLVLFYNYLINTYKDYYQKPHFEPVKITQTPPIKILSKSEVSELFKACDNTLLGIRNKAMLALYYGCGLRKQEGILLDVYDLDLNKGQLLIRKSKTHHQRWVPVSTRTQKILEHYLYNVRERLIPSNDFDSAFLVNQLGKRLSSSTVAYILQKLLKTTNIKGNYSLHTLRHSIATHLLESGMPLESISKFLGHQSLDSTQIYLHVNQNKNYEN